MSPRAVARVLAVIWLTVVWCAVMESAAPGTIVAGVLMGTVLVLAFPTPEGALAGTRVHPVALVVMNASLFWQLVRANVAVAWAVISPSRAGLRRGIVAVPLVPSSELVLQLVLNAVSLTPGTLILEVRQDPLVLYVHVLQLRSEAAVHLEVLGIQRRIVAALGPRAALSVIDERITALADVASHGGPTPDLVEEDP